MKAILIITEQSAREPGLCLSSVLGCFSAPGTLRFGGCGVSAVRWSRCRASRSRWRGADTLGRTRCLFSQHSCLMLCAYQGDQHGSDNTRLTPPAFLHQRVDLLSHLLFSGRQFMSLSMNGVNNSHQYLI